MEWYRGCVGRSFGAGNFGGDGDRVCEVVDSRWNTTLGFRWQRPLEAMLNGRDGLSAALLSEGNRWEARGHVVGMHGWAADGDDRWDAMSSGRDSRQRLWS